MGSVHGWLAPVVDPLATVTGLTGDTTPFEMPVLECVNCGRPPGAPWHSRRGGCRNGTIGRMHSWFSDRRHVFTPDPNTDLRLVYRQVDVDPREVARLAALRAESASTSRPDPTVIQQALDSGKTVAVPHGYHVEFLRPGQVYVGHNALVDATTKDARGPTMTCRECERAADRLRLADTLRSVTVVVVPVLVASISACVALALH